MERYIVMRVLLALSLLFIVIFVIVQLASSGNDNSEDSGPAVEESFVLGEQNNSDSMVRFRVIGRTNALEDHREWRFTITQSNRRVDLVRGYDGEVLKSIVLRNTPNSYQEFLYALEVEGYITERREPVVTNMNGQCSDGKKYEYTAWLNGVEKSRLWSTSCSRRLGTFAGDRSDIVKLFERQFPTFNDFDNGVEL